MLPHRRTLTLLVVLCLGHVLLISSQVPAASGESALGSAALGSVARVQSTRRLKIYARSVAILLTVLVGVSRVYLGLHWPTDVLAGWCLGAAWALMCWIVAARLQREGRVETLHRVEAEVVDRDARAEPLDETPRLDHRGERVGDQAVSFMQVRTCRSSPPAPRWPPSRSRPRRSPGVGRGGCQRDGA